jgi:cation transporter-like permease
MNDGVVDAAIAGATLAVGAEVAGYLIQRFAFRNPRPTYATVLATSMSASMLLFSFVALLTFHIRYNNLGAADVLVKTVR